MCADSVCYFISTDSIHVIIPPNGSVEFKPGFTLMKDTTTQIGEAIYDLKNRTNLSGQIKTHGFYAVNNSNVISSNKDLDLKNKIKFFPNPTSGIISIKHSIPVQRIRIFNWRGQLVFELDGGHEFVDISSLKTGNYLMEINTDSGRVVEKIMKL